MATAKKLPSGNYRVRVYVGKKQDGSPDYKSITASTKKEAERQAALYEYHEKKKKERGMTVGQILSLYIENGSNVLSPASVRKYDSMRRNNFKSIEDKYVSDMRQTDYQAFVNEIALDHAPKTVSSICGLLTAALKAYDPNISLVLKRPKLRDPQITIPTDDQIRQLIERAGSPAMELAFIMGASLGMRRSEICALTWGDIEGKIIHITKAMVQDKNSKWIIKSTKTNAGTRNIEMADFIAERLEALKGNTKKEDFIFHLTPPAITMRFYRASKAIGFKCRFHDLRHYNASIMLALGVPDKYAMQRLGHATPNMLKSVYQHLIDEKEKSVSDDVNNFMSERFSKDK